MPLTAKGEKIKESLTKEYGEKKGEQVLFAGKNKGTFTGIDAVADSVEKLAKRIDSYITRKDALAKVSEVKLGKMGSGAAADASVYKTQEEENKVREERRKKALEESEKQKKPESGSYKSSSGRPFYINK